MSRVSWGFEDIVKGGISIPVTCMGDRMYYGIYVPLSKMPEGGGATAAEQQAPMTQRKLVFHSYSGFERLASSMSGLGGPKFPGSKIVTAHRKEDFTQYLNDLREFLSGKKVAARNEFMAFVSKGSIPTHDAIGLIKAQREQDRTEVADMLSFIKEIPSSYSWTKPLICFFGYESSGKSSLINVLWGMNFRKVGVKEKKCLFVCLFVCLLFTRLLHC